MNYQDPFREPASAGQFEFKVVGTALWRCKLLFFSTVLACLLLAGLYLALAEEVFESTAYVLPPTRSDIEPLNPAVLGKAAFTPDEVYDLFVRNLRSRKMRREFFNEIQLPTSLGDEWRSIPLARAFELLFLDRLSVKRDLRQKDRSDFASVSLEGPDPVVVAEWVNAFLEHVNRATVSELVTDLRAELERQRSLLEDRIRVKRESAESYRLDEIARLIEEDRIARDQLLAEREAILQKASAQRQDRIQRLTEAAEIASSLDLQDPSLLAQASGAQGPEIAISLGSEPLYRYGARALRSEKEVLQRRELDDAFAEDLRDVEKQLALLERNPRVEALQRRENDDPFIEDLRSLEEELQEFNAAQVEPSDLRAMRVDQKAYPAADPIKPRPGLVLTSGLIAGIVLGLLLVAAAYFRSSKRAGAGTEEGRKL